MDSETGSHSQSIATIHDLFLHDLRSILFLEKRLEGELGDMSGEVTEGKLRQELMRHRDETSDHAQRLHQVFEHLEQEPQTHRRADYRGVFEEFERLKQSAGEKEIINLAALNTAIMIERIEVSMYEGLLMLEEKLDLEDEVEELLEDNLESDEEALRRLKKMTKSSWLQQLKENLMS